MKIKTLLFVFASLFISGALFGQDVTVLEGGAANGGVIETTINAEAVGGVDKIYELTKALLKSEIRINFQLSQNQINSIKEKLIGLAVKDAITKAEILAKNIGANIGQVTKIQYGEPRAISNFTRMGSQLETTMSLSGASVRTSITTLKPDEMGMSTSVMMAWDIVY